MTSAWHVLWLAPACLVVNLALPLLPWAELGLPWMFDEPPAETFNQAVCLTIGMTFGFLLRGLDMNRVAIGLVVLLAVALAALAWRPLTSRMWRVRLDDVDCADILSGPQPSSPAEWDLAQRCHRWRPITGGCDQPSWFGNRTC